MKKERFVFQKFPPQKKTQVGFSNVLAMLNKLKLAPWRRAGCKRSRSASPASCPSRWFMISHDLRWLLFAISLCLHLVHKEIFRDIPFSTERGTPTMLTKSTWLFESCAISQQQHHSADREERSSKPEFLGSPVMGNPKNTLDTRDWPCYHRQEKKKLIKLLSKSPGENVTQRIDKSVEANMSWLGHGTHADNLKLLELQLLSTPHLSWRLGHLVL